MQCWSLPLLFFNQPLAKVPWFLPLLRHGVAFLVEAAAAFPRWSAGLKSVKMFSPSPEYFWLKYSTGLGKLQMNWTCLLLPCASHEQVFQAHVKMKPLTLFSDASCYFGARSEGLASERDSLCLGGVCLVSAWSSAGRRAVAGRGLFPGPWLQLLWSNWNLYHQMIMGLLLNGWPWVIPRTWWVA